MTTWTSNELNKIGTVEEPNPAVNDRINNAYHTKYRRYPESIINHIKGSEARAATIKLVPRDEL